MTKIMSRKRYLFLCVAAAIGVMIYCTTATSQGTTILSDQEMAKILGKAGCSCRELDYNDCNMVGVLECATEASCGVFSNKYSNRTRSLCNPVGPDNYQECSSGTMICYTPTYVFDDGNKPDHICNTAKPAGVPDGAGWYNYCSFDPDATCLKCKWLFPQGAPVYVKDEFCHEIEWD